MGRFVEDIRVPIIGTQIPFVYLKYRPVGRRFSNKNVYAALLSKYQVLSLRELDLIGKLSQAIGLQYGEIDVLRDNRSGKIYVVDVNNTPSGPPNHMKIGQADPAILVLANTFGDEFIRSAVRGPRPVGPSPP